MVDIPLWTTYLVFKELSYMPMSVKWAFLGLLASRGLVITVDRKSTGLASSPGSLVRMLPRMGWG